MFDQIQALGYGIVVFAIILGIGSLLLTNFAQSAAACSTGTLSGTNFVWNSTSQTCMNSTGSSQTSTQGTTTSLYFVTQLGTSGLAGWAPAIIALAVGLLFLGAFMVGRGGKNKGRY